MANNIRIKRLNHAFMEEISMILMEEVRDEDLKFVTITGCDITNDLSYAKVYFTVLDKDKKEKIKKIGWNIQNIENIIPNTNVILIGSKKFINEKVFELKERQVENLEIIACYNYNEVKNDMKEIVSKYDGMLNTLGINKI